MDKKDIRTLSLIGHVGGVKYSPNCHNCRDLLYKLCAITVSLAKFIAGGVQWKGECVWKGGLSCFALVGLSGKVQRCQWSPGAAC